MLEMMASRMGGGASGGGSPRGGEAQTRASSGGGAAAEGRGWRGPVGPSSDAGDIAVDPNRPGLQVTHEHGPDERPADKPQGEHKAGLPGTASRP